MVEIPTEFDLQKVFRFLEATTCDDIGDESSPKLDRPRPGSSEGLGAPPISPSQRANTGLDAAFPAGLELDGFTSAVLKATKRFLSQLDSVQIGHLRVALQPAPEEKLKTRRILNKLNDEDIAKFQEALDLKVAQHHTVFHQSHPRPIDTRISFSH